MLFRLRTNQGDTGFKEISEGYFNQLNESYCCLFNAYQFEQKFELVIGNFLELEAEVYTAIMDHMIGRFPGWKTPFEVQLIINRRLANLLSSCRTYFDQVYRHVILCFKGSREEAKLLKTYASSFYDRYPEYRLMEALRNHVQHHSLAVHNCRVGGKNVGQLGEPKIEYGVGFSVVRSELAHNSRFKPEVLKEMEESVDIVSSVRVYIDCINQIQKRGRTILDRGIKGAVDIVSEACGGETSSGKLMQSLAMRLTDEGHMEELIPVNLDFYHELQSLRQKNTAELKFDKGYFTSSSIS